MRHFDPYTTRGYFANKRRPRRLPSWVKSMLTGIALIVCIAWTGYGNVVDAYQDRLSVLDSFLTTKESPEAIETQHGPEMEAWEGPVRPTYDWDDREDIKRMVVNYATLYHVNVAEALWVAECESGFQYSIKNANSTASGVYQFLDGTWANIGSPGDKLNPEDNVRAFMRFYPSNPCWWPECSRVCLTNI